MSLRKDLPAAPVFASLSHPAIERGAAAVRAAAAPDEGVAAWIMEAVQAVGAQIREHRASLNTEITGIKASLTHTQQALAKIETGGGDFGPRGGGERVSAKVLADAASKLEDLRDNRTKSIRMSLPTFHPQAATITSGDLYVPGQRDSEVYGPMRRPVSVRDLLITRPTNAPSIEYLRGTRTGTAGIQAAEGDIKSELGIDFTLLSAAVKTIACWVPASRQILDDSAMLADYIDLELRDALRLKEDEQLLKGNGTGANILGLWSVATAFNRGTGTAGAVGASDTPNDTIRRAVTQLQLARGIATGLVVNPVGLEKLELEKDNEGRYMMSFDVTDNNGRASVWRVPVVVTDAIGADEWMLGDFTRAARLYDRMQASVEVATQHDDFFTRNLVAILAEERVALTVNRPDMLIIGTFEPL